MERKDKNAVAVNAAITSITDEFGDTLAPKLIERLAHAAILGAREAIEDEQRFRDARIALSDGNVAVTPSGVIIVSGDWKRLEYCTSASKDILRASPNYAYVPTEEESRRLIARANLVANKRAIPVALKPAKAVIFDALRLEAKRQEAYVAPVKVEAIPDKPEVSVQVPKRPNLLGIFTKQHVVEGSRKEGATL